MRSDRSILLLLLIVGAVTDAVAAQPWTLTSVDLSIRPVQMQQLSGDALSVQLPSDGHVQKVPLDQFVSIRRMPAIASPTDTFVLLLNDGERFTGEPGPVANGSLTWTNPLLGPLRIPLARLKLIARGPGVAETGAAVKLDTVTTKNGDSVAGVFGDCRDGKIVMQTDADPVEIPLANVSSIAFATTTTAAVQSDAPAMQVELIDSTIVDASNASIDGATLTITPLGENNQAVRIPLASVAAVERINGTVGWLSARTAVEQVQAGFFGRAALWPARFDAAVDGTPLAFNGRLYERGIGVHAYSRLTFDLPPGWAAFRTQYAIDSRRDRPRRFADVTVRIQLDGKTVHEQQHVRDGVLSPVVLIDLKGAKRLTLECDFGDAGDAQARLDWLQPALLRVMPASPATEGH